MASLLLKPEMFALKEFILMLLLLINWLIMYVPHLASEDWTYLSWEIFIYYILLCQRNCNATLKSWCKSLDKQETFTSLFRQWPIYVDTSPTSHILHSWDIHIIGAWSPQCQFDKELVFWSTDYMYSTLKSESMETKASGE